MDLVRVFSDKLSTAELTWFESETGRKYLAKILRMIRSQCGKEAGKAMRNEITVTHAIALILAA